MKVVFDTNVVIDVVQKREPHFADSYKAVQLATKGAIEGVMPVSTLTDVYYIIRHSVKSNARAKEAIIQITHLLNICDAIAEDGTDALMLPMEDYEDAVLAMIAKREKADYIISRNCADFQESPVPAISPTDFLQLEPIK